MTFSVVPHNDAVAQDALSDSSVKVHMTKAGTQGQITQEVEAQLTVLYHDPQLFCR